MKFSNFLNSEVSVYCVFPYSIFFTGFTGILVSEYDESITLNSAVEFNQIHRKYKSIMIKKDTIVSIGQK